MNRTPDTSVDAQLRFKHALRLVEEGRFKEAVKSFHELRKEATENETKTDCLFREIAGLMRLGRTQEARSLLAVAGDLFGDVTESHARGDLLEIQIDSVADKWDRVLPSLDERDAEASGVSKRNIYKALAVCLHQLGDIEQALHYAPMARSQGN